MQEEELRQRASIRRFIQRHLFRLILFTIAIFTSALLISFNAVYLIYILFLPLLHSQMLVDGDNCRQRQIFQQFSDFNFTKPATAASSSQNSDPIQLIWLIFTSTFLIQFLIIFRIFDLLILRAVAPNRLIRLMQDEKRNLVLAHMQHNPLNRVEALSKSDSELSEDFGTSIFCGLFILLACLIYLRQMGNSELGDGTGIPCIRLVDCVQILSLLVLSFRRGLARRRAKLLIKHFASTNLITTKAKSGQRNNRNKMNTGLTDQQLRTLRSELGKIRNRMVVLHQMVERQNASGRALKRSPTQGNNSREQIQSAPCKIGFFAFFQDILNTVGVCLFWYCCILKVCQSAIRFN